LWVNALTLLIMILGTVAQWPEFSAYAGQIAGALAIVNMLLRFITDRPVA
jgi:cytochrome bd-type quinol oxidase subunit 1